MENGPTLTPAGCLQRQNRLRERLAAQRLDAAVITNHRELYYLTGALLDQFPACLVLWADGHTALAAYDVDETPQTVKDFAVYPWHEMFTMNPNPMRLLTGMLTRLLSGRRASRIGWQAESAPRAVGQAIAQVLAPDEWIEVDDALADLESRKDPDEVAVIRRSIRADLAAYAAARQAIAAGVNELDVLAAGQRAAALDAGEPVYHGGDYSSGTFGGPARNRRAEAGELYTVDAQTTYRGYWCDLSRTYSVGRQPTDLQCSIHDHIAALLRDVAGWLKPGMHGTDLWRRLDARICEHPALAASGLRHHAGHGVGLRAHEAPDLNRRREGILEPGHVVSVEPGGYTDTARYGVRLENMFLITDSGAELLSDFPMEL